MRILAALALAAAVAAPQEKAEYSMKWGLPAGNAIEFQVSELKAGKPVPLNRTSLVFAADLEGTANTLLANTYEELPLSFALRLPPEKSKTGARWTVEADLFEQASRALSTMHGFKPVAVRGVMTLGKEEKIDGRECVRLDGQFQLFELKFDSKGRGEAGKTAIAHMNTTTWVTVTDTMPVKISTSYNGRINEFDGIKQGEEAKTAKSVRQLQYDAKKDVLKLDPVKNIDAIHGAIRKGAEWLKKQHNRAGIWMDSGGSFATDFPVGSTGLSLMALLHSGVKTDDPAVKLGYSAMQRAEFRKVYDVAASIMAVETRYLPLEQYEEIEELTEEKAREAIAKSITKEDQGYLQRAVDWLLSKQTKPGTWGYPEQSEDYDNSNTQYALLALKSAARCGIKVRSDVWKKILQYWLGTQKFTPSPKVALSIKWMNEKDPAVTTKAAEEVLMGAWGYFVRKHPQVPEQVPDLGYGSMVCAGLTSLVIAQSELLFQKEMDDDVKKRVDSAVKSGLAWLQHHYSVRGCPPSAGFWSVFYMYYLYSIERVGVLLGVKEIGGHDWYQEGALLLVRAQRPDGSWMSYDQLPIVDTAFALLFLKKATVKVATR